MTNANPLQPAAFELQPAALPSPVTAAPFPPRPLVAVEIVARMFPATPVANIAANLPPVLAALAAAKLADKDMLLVALATIRAETESFLPISEAESPCNTSPGGHPFDLYDHRADLGNQGPPDGASFRGRGFVQLTGRANYTRYARELSRDGVANPDPAANCDLVANPGLACEPAVAARLLARFLADKQAAIRRALAANSLAAVRRLVNGGTHGLDRFTSAYQIGARLIPDPPQPLTADR
jgi:putative chitinase